MLPRSTVAQVIGEDLCACQPAEIELILQLDRTCDENDITEETPGISDTACIISSRTPSDVEVSDFVPVTVEEILVLELDQNQEVVSQTLLNKGYVNGETVSFTSIVAEEPESINPVSLPSGLTVTITGTNTDGQPLLNTWAIRYDNDCTIYPVLTTGQQIGWAQFVSTFRLICYLSFRHSELFATLYLGTGNPRWSTLRFRLLPCCPNASAS